MSEVLKVGELNVEVRRSARRRTVDLIVDRGGTVVAAVPANMTTGEIEALIRRKSLWIHSTLALKKRVLREQSPKEYVSGEGLFYLGRSYRLKLIELPPAGPQCRRFSSKTVGFSCGGKGTGR